MTIASSNKPKRTPVNGVAAKPKASAALTPKEFKAVAMTCATRGKANDALKAYIASGNARRKAS